MKQIRLFAVGIVLLLFVAACGGGVSAKWQEQYDLGMKYLLEEDYEEAVLAFTAAIEIEPKLPEAYIGRGDAYVGLSNAKDIEEADKNAYYDLALGDYIAAIEIKSDVPEYYEKLMGAYYDGANVDMERLKKLLEVGIEKTGNEELQYLLDITETPMGNFKNKDFKYLYELDEESESSIKELVEIVKSGESDATRNAMMMVKLPTGRSGEVYKKVRTYFSGYKLKITEDMVEIRPAEGWGYELWDWEDSGLDIFVTGEITDWGWNGAFQTEQYKKGSSFPDYAIRGKTVGGLICGVAEEMFVDGEWEYTMYDENGHLFQGRANGESSRDFDGDVIRYGGYTFHDKNNRYCDTIDCRSVYPEDLGKAWWKEKWGSWD